MNNPLFRKEVIESKNQNFGAISLNTPRHYVKVALSLAVLVFLIGVFILFADYTEKFIVTGYLNSTKGIVSVYPSKQGIIIRSSVVQGMHVHLGDELFQIDTSYEGLVDKKQSQILQQLEQRKKRIEHEILDKQKQLQAFEPLMLKKFIPVTAYNEIQDNLTVLENNKSLIAMDIIKFMQESAYVVRSPINGIISSIAYKEGQSIQVSKPLLKLLPDNAKLVAELFVPIKQSGFLTKDNKIIIRYDAYPYERFGSYPAVIDGISKTIVTDEEEDKPLQMGQPYYKVTAHLESPFVRVYGKEKEVQHGMTISAVILGSKRKLWQWIFDPIYSFYGGLRQ